ncbi:MAG: methyltransferase domain-containing protein [Myxococcota bacterium]
MSFARAAYARLRLSLGAAPLSVHWGADRGQPIHRYYIEQFFDRHRARIRGRCLEFNDRRYLDQFSDGRATRVDVIHLEEGNPEATIVADLTQKNSIPDGAFDAIVCSHVLHIVFDLEAMVRELYRILAPGGALLVAVPAVSMAGPEYPELWRFTPLGLRKTLERAFAPDQLQIAAFGSSLTAAAELRGVVAEELGPALLGAHDARFAVEVCALATRPPLAEGAGAA